MIVTTKEPFAHAYGKYAVGAYNINNLSRPWGAVPPQPRQARERRCGRR
ncbi:MAG: hypothetical protein ACLQLO_28410 [Mycobacterium sp.]